MRYWFGGSPADYVISPGQQTQLPGEMVGYQTVLVPGVRLWVYAYDTGDRVTDLLDATGNQVDSLLTAEYGAIPRFRGPDETRRLLVGPEPTGVGDPDPGDDPLEVQGRWIITTSDWPTIVSGLDTRIGALEEGGGGGDDPGEPVGSAHPLVWTYPGLVDEDRTSPHPVWNLDGKAQRVTVVRAQATVVSGEVTCTVLAIDPDTQTHTVVAAVQLDTTTGHAVVSPDAIVSDGTGLTVAVERTTADDEISDVTVQVMVR